MNENKKLRVMRIIARLNIGGPSIHTSLLAEGMTHRGWTTKLIAGTVSEDEGDMSYYAENRGVKPHYIRSLGREISLVKDSITFMSLCNEIRKFRPHVIHTHTAKAGFLGRAAGIIMGVPVMVHTFHGHVFHSYFSPFKTGLFLTIERTLARFTDKIITVGEIQRSEILGYGIGHPSKVRSIPLGFDFSNLAITPELRKKNRSSYDLKDDDFVIGIVARLVPVKDHDLFLDAAALASEKNSKLKFMIIGDGELRDDLDARVRDLGLSDRVIFTGWKTDLNEIYSSLDAATLTSKNEGLPVTLIEALASGIPVVSCDVGGVRDIIDVDKSGYVVSKRCPHQLADAYIRLSSDPVRAQKMGELGMTITRKRFSHHRLVDDMDRLYRSIIRKKYSTPEGEK
jgi:glycosyltransferase involved in cell wall biosynthesis